MGEYTDTTNTNGIYGDITLVSINGELSYLHELDEDTQQMLYMWRAEDEIKFMAKRILLTEKYNKSKIRLDKVSSVLKKIFIITTWVLFGISVVCYLFK